MPNTFLSNLSMSQIYSAVVASKTISAAVKKLEVSRTLALKNHLSQFTFNGLPLTFHRLKNMAESSLNDIQSNVIPLVERQTDRVVAPCTLQSNPKNIITKELIDLSGRKRTFLESLPTVIHQEPSTKKQRLQSLKGTDGKQLFRQLQSLVNGTADQELVHALNNKFIALGFNIDDINLLTSKHNASCLQTVLTYSAALQSNHHFSTANIIEILPSTGADRLFALITNTDNWSLLIKPEPNGLHLSLEDIVKIVKKEGGHLTLSFLLAKTGDKTNWSILRNEFNLSKEQLIDIASNSGAKKLFMFLLGETGGRKNWQILREDFNLSHEQIVAISSKANSNQRIELLLRHGAQWMALDGFNYSTEFIVYLLQHRKGYGLLKKSSKENSPDPMLSSDLFLSYKDRVVAPCSLQSLKGTDGKQLFRQLQSLVNGNADQELVHALNNKFIALGFNIDDINLLTSKHNPPCLQAVLTYSAVLQSNHHFSTANIIEILPSAGADRLFALITNTDSWSLLIKPEPNGLHLSLEDIVKIGKKEGGHLTLSFLLAKTGDKTNWSILRNEFNLSKEQLIDIASNNGAKKLFIFLLGETGGEKNWSILRIDFHLSVEQIVSMASNKGARQLFMLLLGKTDGRKNWSILCIDFNLSVEQMVSMASNAGACQLFMLLLGKTDGRKNWQILREDFNLSHEQIVAILSKSNSSKRVELLLKGSLKQTSPNPELLKDLLLSYENNQRARYLGGQAASFGYRRSNNHNKKTDYILCYYQAYFDKLVDIDIISKTENYYFMQQLTKTAEQLPHKTAGFQVYMQAIEYLDTPNIKTWRMLCRGTRCEQLDFPFAYYKVPQPTSEMSDIERASYPSEAIIINFDQYVIKGLDAESEKMTLSLKAKQQLARLFKQKYYHILREENKTDDEHYDDFNASFHQGYLFIRHYGYLFDLMGENARNFRKNMADIPEVDYTLMPVKDYLNYLAKQTRPFVAQTSLLSAESSLYNGDGFNPGDELKAQELLAMLNTSYEERRRNTQTNPVETQSSSVLNRRDDFATDDLEEEYSHLFSLARTPYGFFAQANLSPTLEREDDELDLSF